MSSANSSITIVDENARLFTYECYITNIYRTLYFLMKRYYDVHIRSYCGDYITSGLVKRKLIKIYFDTCKYVAIKGYYPYNNNATRYKGN